MIKEVTIKTIRLTGKKADGTDYVNKSGQNFSMAFLETECHISASKYLDTKFGAKAKEIIEKWQPGDKVTVTIEKSGDFTNFDLPKATDLLEDRVVELENRLDKFAKLWTEKFPVTKVTKVTKEDGNQPATKEDLDDWQFPA